MEEAVHCFRIEVTTICRLERFIEMRKVDCTINELKISLLLLQRCERRERSWKEVVVEGVLLTSRGNALQLTLA